MSKHSFEPKAKPKRPVGRPTLYRPEYCEKLIEHMSQGYSFESFAATVGTHRGVLYEWANKHKEFQDAKSRATELCMLHWEKLGMAGMMGKVPSFGGSMWMFNMKCRFRWIEPTVNLETSDSAEFKKVLDEALKELDEEAQK